MRKHRPRRAGILPTIGLIVEGETEFKALPMLHRRGKKPGLMPACPPLKAVNLHGVGSDRTPSAIAKLLVKKVVGHQAAGRSRIVACIDREQRAECPGEFAQSVENALYAQLAKIGRPTAGVNVVVADRTFEAWLLADAGGLHARGAVKVRPPPGRFEGSLGLDHKKGELELCTLLGRPYEKTIDGPRLFEQLAFHDARNHTQKHSGSKSLDKFLRTLGL